jgi:hypothetical protein
MMSKKSLSETDICAKFITPAVVQAGWNEAMQIRREVGFTKGRIIVRGKLVTRGQAKRADYILYYKPNIPIALIEAKDNSHSVGDGMQQALDYAETLEIPFIFSSNGDGFVFHDRTGTSAEREAALALDNFPPPASPGSAGFRYAHAGVPAVRLLGGDARQVIGQGPLLPPSPEHLDVGEQRSGPATNPCGRVGGDAPPVAVVTRFRPEPDGRWRPAPQPACRALP